MKYAKFNRGVALLTLIAFVITNNWMIPKAYSEPVRIDSAPIKTIALDNLKLPAKFGEVVESYSGKNGVIIVQDAHAIPDAQKNIANMIKLMRTEYGVKTVALEGASGDLDPQIFRSFPDQKMLREVIKGYLDAGEIAGGTAASIFDNDASVYKGVEDWDLYEETLGFYLKAMDAAPALLEKWESSNQLLLSEKQKLYSAELFAADAAVQKFYSNLSEVTDLFKVLGKVQAPPASSDLEAVWKEVNKGQATEGQSHQTKDIEVRQISDRVEKFLKNQKSGDKDIQKVFYSKKQEWMTGAVGPESFAMYLKETAEKFQIHIEMSTELLGMVHEQRK